MSFVPEGCGFCFPRWDLRVDPEVWAVVFSHDSLSGFLLTCLSSYGSVCCSVYCMFCRFRPWLVSLCFVISDLFLVGRFLRPPFVRQVNFSWIYGFIFIHLTHTIIRFFLSFSINDLSASLQLVSVCLCVDASQNGTPTGGLCHKWELLQDNLFCVTTPGSSMSFVCSVADDESETTGIARVLGSYFPLHSLGPDVDKVIRTGIFAFKFTTHPPQQLFILELPFVSLFWLYE